jgi:hypothetical protein
VKQQQPEILALLTSIERLLRVLVEQHRAGDRELLTKAQAARALGISKSRVLQPLIDRGLVQTVARGSRKGIPRAEVERLAREGVLLAPGAKARPGGRRAGGARRATPGHAAAFARRLVSGSG